MGIKFFSKVEKLPLVKFVISYKIWIELIQSKKTQQFKVVFEKNSLNAHGGTVRGHKKDNKWITIFFMTSTF